MTLSPRIASLPSVTKDPALATVECGRSSLGSFDYGVFRRARSPSCEPTTLPRSSSQAANDFTAVRLLFAAAHVSAALKRFPGSHPPLGP
ncbi:hypothetical protein MRX96_022273 [Rhipicephalus microplus]